MIRTLRFRRRLTVAGIFLLCILFLAFYFAFRGAMQPEGINQWVARTQEVLGAIAQAQLNRAWLESEVWGYRETHNPGFQGKFQGDRRGLDDAMKHLQQLTEDTGMGMDAETREHMFEPFFTTKTPGKGTGMGLATVYGIVKQHGGFIHAYSEPGQGTLFRVYLPATNGEVADSPAARTPKISLAEMRGTETILIAEDHESIREMARQTLLSLGYRVLSACDGEEALLLCENETPALAILDMVMPKLGGPATAVKLEECIANLPVLFTSGYSQDADGVATATKNAHYLQKPYSPIMLSRLVREILDEAKKKKAAG